MPEIESGIPLPQPSEVRYKWPWKKLEVGESFLVPLNGQDEAIVLASMRGQCCNTSRKLGKQFVVARVPRGVRVWRKQ